MIGFLKGTIQSKNANSLIIDVHDIGYQVFTPLFLIQELELDNPVALFIYTHVREDELSLFGFSTQEEKQIFLYLISVSGIGPKLSLNILSSANGAKNIVNAIKNANVDFFENIKGVGKKSAQRIIIDLKSKIGGLKELEFEAEADRDLIDALKSLDFSHEEIKKSILNVNKSLHNKRIKKDLSLEEKIKLALKEK